MTNAASQPLPDASSPTAGAAPPVRSGVGRWALLLACVAVGVGGWQWYVAHRAEQASRRLAVIECVIGLEQARDNAQLGSLRLAQAVLPSPIGEWQKLAISVRSPEVRPTNLDMPQDFWLEIIGGNFSDVDRKLRAAASALNSPECAVADIEVVLEDVKAAMYRIVDAERRIIHYIQDPLWQVAASLRGHEAVASTLERALLPHLAQIRSAMVFGEKDKATAQYLLGERADVYGPRKKIEWLLSPPRIAEWVRLTEETNRLTEGLAKSLPRPEGATGSGPSQWLRSAGDSVVTQLLLADPSTDFARWSRSLEIANQLLADLAELAACENALVREKREAQGYVPITIWTQIEREMSDCRLAVWEAPSGKVREFLRGWDALQAIREKWLEQIRETRLLLSRWEGLPEAVRQAKAPNAISKFRLVLDSNSASIEEFVSAREELREAIERVAEVWLSASLSDLAPRLQRSESLAIAEWSRLDRWFGRDMRLDGLRDLAASAMSARIASLDKCGLVPQVDAEIDLVTSLPKLVVHRATGIVMVLVPAGKFLMGSPSQEHLRDGDEVQHWREIRSPFYLGVTEVTQSQWMAIMQSNPSQFVGSTLPVGSVSWEDCREFLAKVGGTLRLPSEAEWEYACRAGEVGAFSTVGSSAHAQANFDGGYAYPAAIMGLTRHATVAAGSLPPNRWGLHEMHGNVWEWCEDGYGDYPLSGTEAPLRPSGPRVARGGCWFSEASQCRAANRLRGGAVFRNDHFGFRVACSMPQ